MQLLARLTERRFSVEKELGALGDEKKGQQDIFRHCRGFERAFQVMLNEANVSFKIRAVVEGVLPETLAKIPIEKRFNKNYTREVCREADGSIWARSMLDVSNLACYSCLESRC